jgi:hypothetical protein
MDMVMSWHQHAGQNHKGKHIINHLKGWNISNTGLFKMIHPVGLHNQASLQNMPNSRLGNSQFSTGAVGWLPWATLDTLCDSLHIILWHMWSSCALAFTQTSSFCKLPVYVMDALSTQWNNSVMSTKLMLQCDYRFTPQKLQHTKHLLLRGCHFLTDCHRATATVEPSHFDLLQLGDFLLHLVNAKLIRGWWVQNYVRLNSDELFWITLYLGRTLRNKNSMHEEIMSWLKAWHACHHSVQNILPSS